MLSSLYETWLPPLFPTDSLGFSRNAGLWCVIFHAKRTGPHTQSRTAHPRFAFQPSLLWLLSMGFPGTIYPLLQLQATVTPPKKNQFIFSAAPLFPFSLLRASGENTGKGGSTQLIRSRLILESLSNIYG